MTQLLQTSTRLNVITRDLLIEISTHTDETPVVFEMIASMARAAGIDRVAVSPGYVCCLPPEEYDWPEMMAPYYGIFEDLQERVHATLIASGIPFDWTRQASDLLRWLPEAPEPDPFVTTRSY